MGFDNTFQGSPPSGVPNGPSLGLDTTTGTLYVSSAQTGAWTKALGNPSGSFAAGNAVIGTGSSAVADSGQSLLPVSSTATIPVTSLSSGDNALYTVPSGKLAVMRLQAFNPTNGSITIFPTITPNGTSTIYRIAANAVLAAPPSNNANADYQLGPYLMASAGDVIGLNCNSSGINAHLELLLVNISNSSTWKQAILTTFSIGDNTVYTVPTGKTAYMGYGNFMFFGSFGNQFGYSNESGGNATISVNIVASGGSPSSANKVFAPLALATASFTNLAQVKKLSAGDFISVNTTTNGKQLFTTIILETTP